MFGEAGDRLFAIPGASLAKFTNDSGETREFLGFVGRGAVAHAAKFSIGVCSFAEKAYAGRLRSPRDYPLRKVARCALMHRTRSSRATRRQSPRQRADDTLPPLSPREIDVAANFATLCRRDAVLLDHQPRQRNQRMRKQFLSRRRGHLDREVSGMLEFAIFGLFTHRSSLTLRFPS